MSKTSSLTNPTILFTSVPRLSPSAAGPALARHYLRVTATSYSALVSFATVRTYAKHRRMPPKKQVAEKKVLLGRPGNNLKSGIVCRDITPWAKLLLTVLLIGRPRQRGEIYTISSHYKMLTG